MRYKDLKIVEQKRPTVSNDRFYFAEALNAITLLEVSKMAAGQWLATAEKSSGVPTKYIDACVRSISSGKTFQYKDPKTKEEKAGVVPNTKWKKRELGKNWYIGETLHSGIGQGYFLTTPLQLSLMTAQIANGGFKISPRILVNENEKFSNLEKYINHKSNKHVHDYLY